MKRNIIYLLALIWIFPLVAQDVVFTPPRIILEEEENSLFFTDGVKVELENQGDKTVTLRLISSRPEILADPAELTLAPGEKAGTFLSYEGAIPPRGERILPLVILSEAGVAPPRYLIYSPRDFTPSASDDSSGGADVHLVYYYSPTCRDCRDFLEKEIPALEKELGMDIGLETVNIFEEEGMARLRERLEQRGIESDELPILDTGDVLLTGDVMIRESLRDVLTGEYVSSGKSPATANAPLWILVGGAGLLDGINPCAFSTLIFLLAYLGLRKGSRKEILMVGSFFTLTVFLTYTAVGAGAFLFLRQSMSYRWISPILRWGGGSVLFLLGLLSLRDWNRVRKGQASEMSLQLSGKMKRAIHKSVRGGVKSSLPVVGACLMGFMVTIYELGCTGQIYLPTLYLMIKRGEGSGLILLLLYNLAFILPLGAVFLLAYRGMTSEKLSLWFQDRLASVKLMTALFFWAAAGLIILL